MINITKIAKNNIKYNKSKSILIILTIFLDNTLLNLDKNNGFISFFLAKTLRLDNHGYILFL